MQPVDDTYEINDSDIAIIAMSGRFPGAKKIETFWENLKNGVESISFFSEAELLSSGVSANLIENDNYIRAKGVLEDIDLFDADFFDFSPREAEIIDPQQRLFLECAWEAIEQAGYDPSSYKGLIGVYGGVGINSYLLNNLYGHQDIWESVGEYQIVLDNDKDFLPSRVAYKLNLTGPAINIQTSCSTSLVSVHLACQSLLNGECDMALAGGATVFVPHKIGYLYQEGMILSPDGHCRAFDAQAKGTVDGNGVAIVLLKRLEDAINDGDRIHAVIKGSAVNNDGSLKVGYTAPSVEGQAAVITEALAIADVDPESISYIEAHGTGTELGDPMEIAALNKAYGKKTAKKHFCALGAVKTNIGHLDTAAGVAGLIKTVLALEHKLKPPTVNFESPSPKIDFANSPFYVNQTLTPWEGNGGPRRAGVSSFGIGGTNVHVILEEAPLLASGSESRPWQLLLVSAKTNSALNRATANLAASLKQDRNLNLADVAYTLSCGRRHFDRRRILVCQNLEQAVTNLSNLDSELLFSNAGEAKVRSVAFLFPGQGSQYVNMTRELYETESIFREQVDLCSEIVQSELGLDIRKIIYPAPEEMAAAASQLQKTEVSQSAIFAIAYSLARLWISWGVSPQAMLGHSIGEYVAACLAGVFSLKDALLLVAARGRMMQQLPGGTMLSIPLTVEQVKPLLTEKLSIAVINEPSRCVVSGPTASIDDLQNKLATRGVECRRLHTSHAFHSAMMEPILEPFTQRVKQVSLHPPQIPYISNLTGTWITAEQATDPQYWTQHLRQTVNFSSGLENLFQNPEQILLEVGPGRTLSSLAKQHPLKAKEQLAFNSVRHPQENKSDVAYLLTTLGRLWLAGVKVNWPDLYEGEKRYRIHLPTYPFERQRHWVEPPEKSAHTSSNKSLLEEKQPISDWFYIPSWKRMALSYSQASKLSGNLLLFIDERGIGEKLAEGLREQNKNVILVKVGSQFSKQAEGVYTLNPQAKNDYETLVKELQSQNLRPDRVVHLWSITDRDSSEELDVELVEKSQAVGFYSLLFFVQACSQNVFTDKCQITVISNDMQDVTGEEMLCPEKATLLGPVQTIPQEYPNFTCCSIDIMIPKSQQEENQLIEQLLTEFTGESTDKNIAYRGRYRWIQTFEQVKLADPAEVGRERQGLREKGVYLITGGLSYLGFVLAQYLGKTVRAKLILISRSGIPERENWPQWLESHEKEDNVSSRIRKVLELEALGAEVLVLKADVADLQQMEAVINQAEAQLGEINGVIHVAGAGAIWKETINIIEDISKEECEKQFQAKVYGTLVLGKLLQKKQLDFCILTSSLSSILGGLGFIAYGAVNIFMDAFVQQYNKENNASWLSVNWDGWKGGQEIVVNGMSLGAEAAELEIAPAEGVKAFEYILAGAQGNQLVVSTVALEPRIELWVKRSYRDQNRSQVLAATGERQNLENYIAPRNQVEITIANIFKSLVGVAEIGIHDSFLELGGDSLTGTQLLSKLKQAFAINLPITAVFESPTVAQLAEIIESERESEKSDLDKIGDILQMVEELSAAEVDKISLSNN